MFLHVFIFRVVARLTDLEKEIRFLDGHIKDQEKDHFDKIQRGKMTKTQSKINLDNLMAIRKRLVKFIPKENQLSLL